MYIFISTFDHHCFIIGTFIVLKTDSAKLQTKLINQKQITYVHTQHINAKEIYSDNSNYF
jgi:hypothetical protein